MRRLFSKKEVLTIPNLLSLFRLCLIPVIVWLYCGKEWYGAAIGVLILSGISDVVDGWIARKFNMVSDFGKVLDPLADKLTQGTLLICLLFRYPMMWAVIAVFALREVVMLILGGIVIQKKDMVSGARWHGKANTVVIYTVTMLLILFPKIPLAAVNGMLLLCMITMITSLILYARGYLRILRKK